MSVLHFVVLAVVFEFYGERLILSDERETRETLVIVYVILEKTKV